MGDKSQKTQIRIDNQLAAYSGNALQGARSLYQDQRELPSTYVGMDPRRRYGLAQEAALAAGGTPVPRASVNEYLKNVGGGYLNANPYARQIVNRSVMASLNPIVSGFAGAGRFGSGAYANAVADMAQETASRIYGGLYESERDRMQQALGYAPQMYEMQYADPRTLQAAGQQYEADRYAQAQEQVRQFMWPYQKQSLYEQSLGASPLNAARKSEQWQPFDWKGAGLQMVSGLLSPQMPGMGGMA